MPAAAHGQEEIIASGDLNGMYDVGHAGAAGNGAGVFVDHRVPDAARVIVAGIIRQNDRAAHAGLEVLDRVWGDRVHVIILVVR